MTFTRCLLLSPVILFLLPLCAQCQRPTYDTTALQQLITFCEETLADEVLLVRRGQLISHWKDDHCDSLYFNTASMVKSWTGLAVGTLVDRGLIDVNDAVCKYLPQWEDGCTHGVTIRHLLTMSAGLNRKGGRGILSKHNMNEYVLNTQLDTFPGVRFAYSNESVQLLGMIIEAVSGQRVGEYFQKVLFDPLQMDATSLMRDSSGNDIVYGGARTTVSDAARIGQLMLDKGQYQGRQIVSKQWIDASVSPSALAPYYGYLWWLDLQSEHPNYAAMGDYGQMTIVFPDLELIMVRRQVCEKPPGNNMRWMGPHFLKMIADVVSP